MLFICCRSHFAECAVDLRQVFHKAALFISQKCRNAALGRLGCVSLCACQSMGQWSLESCTKVLKAVQKFQEVSEKGPQAEACSSLAPVWLTEIIPEGQEENRGEL